MKLLFNILLFKAYHSMRSAIRPQNSAIGLSPGQPKVLHFLLHQPQCTQAELARGCDLEAATISKMLNIMEDHELIQRILVPQNRRILTIQVTDKGKQLHEQWLLICKDVEELALQGFTSQERQQFSSFLCRMYANLSNKEIE